MYYFGYCTFLNPKEAGRFFPNGKTVAKGYVANSNFSFRTVGERRERGWCHMDMTAAAWGGKTLGCVIEHDESKFVDYPDFLRVAVTVHGEDGNIYDCWTWILDDPGIPMKPPKNYWEHVDIGLDNYEFPADYKQAIYDMYNASADCPE